MSEYEKEIQEDFEEWWEEGRHIDGPNIKWNMWRAFKAGYQLGHDDGYLDGVTE